jgi:hypothetical protein
MNLNYDNYNREERNLCSHLFRLLHEGLADNYLDSPFASVLKILSSKSIKFSGKVLQPGSLSFNNSSRRFFDAKPDLAVVIDDYIIVLEAKLTLDFMKFN